MLHYLLEWLNGQYDIPGFGVFQYITFRAVLSIIFSLIISIMIGKQMILLLRRKLIGETIRDDGPESHKAKKGTPTMGGVIIFAAIFFPTLLWGDLKNGYIWLILIATTWMFVIGFVDDYIKVFKKDKQGLQGRFKILGQVSLGLIVGLVMIFHPDFMGSRAHITQLNIITPSKFLAQAGFQQGDELQKMNGKEFESISDETAYSKIESYTVLRKYSEEDEGEEVLIQIDEVNRKLVASEMFGAKDKSFIYQTDFPFLKTYVFDYSKVLVLKHFLPEQLLGRIVFVLITIFIITAVSNGVNITDGIDGLAAGTTAIAGATLGILAYVSGNTIFADYLNISYIPLSSELLVYAAALVGACLGFLWYNTYPAQVFMGDTGSLMLGGAVGVLALMVKKELLLPIICGIFFVESLSVILQVSYFKFTKKRFGEGRRIFKMAPLHHHYELSGLHESKIVTRFWIVAVGLALLAFATLKLR